jgi:hypothetical protein
MTSTTEKLVYCDSVWNNRRNAPKFWPQDIEKKEWDIVGTDSSNITATCWKDKRERGILHSSAVQEIFGANYGVL